MSQFDASDHCPLSRHFVSLQVILKPMILILAIVLSFGCSTRQLSDTVTGSTAQRLVTYSLEKFVRKLVKQPEMKQLTGQTVALTVNFLDDHTLIDYATQLIRYQLESRYRVVLTDNVDSAQYEINVFFNSIGTDYDSFGLSLPGIGLAAVPDSRINLLSIDMFHGITEGYALLKNTQSAATDRTQRLLARVRADNVSTPILEFPVNQLD